MNIEKQSVSSTQHSEQMIAGQACSSLVKSTETTCTMQPKNISSGSSHLSHASKDMHQPKPLSKHSANHATSNDTSTPTQPDHGKIQNNQTTQDVESIPQAQLSEPNSQTRAESPVTLEPAVAKNIKTPRTPLPAWDAHNTQLPTPSVTPPKSKTNTFPSPLLGGYDDEIDKTIQDPAVVSQEQSAGSTNRTSHNFSASPSVCRGRSAQQISRESRATIGSQPVDEMYDHTIQQQDGNVPDPARGPVPFQASRNCFARLNHGDFPIETCKDGLRNPAAIAAWLPYISALGLEQSKFPKIQVTRKKAQNNKAGKPMSKEKKQQPSWAFLIYVLLAVSPQGKLTKHEIFNLALTWCPGLEPNDSTCRHQLTTSEEFRRVDRDDKNNMYWRLARSDEQPKGKKPKLKKASTSKTKKDGQSNVTAEVCLEDYNVESSFEASSSDDTSRQLDTGNNGPSSSNHNATSSDILALSSISQGSGAWNPINKDVRKSGRERKRPRRFDIDDAEPDSAPPPKRVKLPKASSQPREKPPLNAHQVRVLSLVRQDTGPNDLFGMAHRGAPKRKRRLSFVVESADEEDQNKDTSFEDIRDEPEAGDSSKKNDHHYGASTYNNGSITASSGQTSILNSHRNHAKEREEELTSGQAEHPWGEESLINSWSRANKKWKQPPAKGEPFMVDLPKGEALQQRPGHIARYGFKKNITVTEYKRDVLEWANKNMGAAFRKELHNDFKRVEINWVPDYDRRFLKLMDRQFDKHHPQFGTRSQKGKEASDNPMSLEGRIVLAPLRENFDGVSNDRAERLPGLRGTGTDQGTTANFRGTDDMHNSC